MEEKESITSLDLSFLIKELQGLVGGRIGKIYQKGKRFRIQIYISGKGNYELVFSPSTIYLTEYKRKAPPQPPNFCMFLRKYLKGKRIREIKQYKFDRIFQIHTDDYIMIAEIFSKGNVILCTSSYKIKMPLEVQRWKSREISPDKQYKYPPTNPDPRKLKFEEFSNVLSGEIVRCLASDLGFGGTYAEEICLRASIDKQKKGEELTRKERKTLFNSMKEMFKDKSPSIVYENGEKKDVVPIQMKKYEAKEKEEYDSFSQALDQYFSQKEKKEVEEKKEEVFEEKIGKIEKRKEEQKEARENWKKEARESREIAELIYNNYGLVEGILSGINKAKDQGLSWDEIKNRVEREETPEAEGIEEIKEAEGKVVVEIKDKEIELDFRKGVEENAEIFYERAKKAESKLEGVEKHLEESEEKEKEIEEKGVEDIEVKEKKPERKVKEKKEWYERFRWSFSSEGFLIIGGKNADQNEELMKKYLEKDDIVLHSEIKGAPFVIVKSQDKEITPLAIREAAEIAAAYSSAWKKGYGNVDVYWVRPEQASKEAPSGEYIGKGSFMIKGEKNYLRKRELKISIGVKLDRDRYKAKVIAGSVQGMKKNADYFVTIKPGTIESLELSEKIKRKIMEKSVPEDKKLIDKIPRERFQKFIPPGKGVLIG